MALRKDAVMLDRSDVVKLVKNDEYQDERGVWHDSENTREVYCHVSSVTSQEWHSANQSGLKASYVFTIFSPDYEGEELVEYNGDRYSVMRTYHMQDDNIELHCATKKGTQDE